MMTKFYVDQNGKYVGGFDGVTPPAGSVEVPSPPSHADFETWNFGASQWDRDTDADDREAAGEFTGDFEDNRVKRLLFEINFDQENRLRALEGAPAITKAQYKAALINLLKTL